MNKKILILDDDADVLDMLSYFLSESGYEVDTLLSGEKVFEAIANFRPDLMLMDVILTNMDGRDMRARLKSKPATKSLPVILISVTNDVFELYSPKGAPCDFLIKPFDMETLLKKVELQLAA
jgi:DNA-binding response OmpR family regulator